MLAAIREDVQKAIQKGLLTDAFVFHIGDDIDIIMSHTRGPDDTDVHQFAWNAFLKGTSVAAQNGFYGAGQDLLVDAPSGNVRGAGPGVAELEFEHSLGKGNAVRPAESFMVFGADKCGPGAYNLPLFLGFADPMFTPGLMLPKMKKGFRFRVIDMDHVETDSVIDLDAPDAYYDITALLRDNERFAIDGIFSRTYPDQQGAAVSAQRLHNIAGTYTGKDDPVAIVRNQGIFPAPEELVMPFTKAHYVGGDARGSHVMPIMPVPMNTAVTGYFCIPIVCALGFSMDERGRFSGNYVDFFDNPAWDTIRWKAQEKAYAMREQGWSGAAMLPYHELEYGGFRDTVEGLMARFGAKQTPNGTKPAAGASAAKHDKDPD